MEIEYLWPLLEDNEIFLNFDGWEKWGDKNDVELIKIYNDKIKNKKFGVTCFTYGSDKIHYWTAYCKRENGVCLWFDKTELEKDIEKDPNLKCRDVIYLTPKELSENGKLSELPFCKRKQYIDEKEFRVFRELKNGDTSNTRGFEFSPKTLKRVYFNSWLDKECKKALVAKAKEKLSDGYAHVKIKQNKVHKFKKWTNIAKELK